jgi:hypothetical protein
MNENEPIPEAAPSENPIPPTSAVPESEPPKKRRGRPPKNPSLNPESPGSSTGTSSGPKKRSTKMGTDQINALAMQIQGIHAIAAAITNLPEIGLVDQEAAALANSVANMAAQYDLSLDGKTGAAIQLLATAAMIYTPRYFAIRNRMNQPPTGNVVEMPNVASHN